MRIDTSRPRVIRTAIRHLARRHGSAVLFAVALVTAAQPVHANSEVTAFAISELPTLLGGPWLPSGGPYSYTFGLNDTGQIVGRSTAQLLTSTSFGSTRAASWTNGTVANLGALNNLRDSTATAISSSGVIVGYSDFSPSQVRAVIFAPTGPTELGLPNASFQSTRALSINSQGVIVGYGSLSSNVTGDRPTVWNGATASTLGTLGGTYGRAAAVNDSGLIVGYSATTGNQASRATLWSGASIIDLGTLGGSFSYASDINNLGQAVGRSQATGNSSSRATLWHQGQVIDLGTLGGTFSEAFAINDNGWIVGSSFTAGNTEERAFLWLSGQLFDLNSLVPDMPSSWTLRNASALNENGWITGQAVDSITGENFAYLLVTSPIPEPEALLLWIFGGIALVHSVYRRKAYLLEAPLQRMREDA
jgi:probable HAF family extracellular repeat protein